MKKILNKTTSKTEKVIIPCTPHWMIVEVGFINGTEKSFAGEACQCGRKVTIVNKEEFIEIPLENILYYRMKEEKKTTREETLWCLWKHFKSFLEQSIEEKTADFGKPCSDCKLWDSCKGDWQSKIGKSKPSGITINVGSGVEEEEG